MAQQVRAALAIKPDGVYVDATFGRGGHSRDILAALGPDGRLVAVDRDPQAVAAGQAEFGGDARFSISKRPFSMLEAHVKELKLQGRVDGLVLDLGVSSPQLEDSARGFSFTRSGPLDMRMDPDTGISARDWLSTAEEPELRQVIRTLGEERFAGRIARAITLARKETPIETTEQLAGIVAAAVPGHEPGKHPATRTFQAIRMYLNRELEELEAVLPQAERVLAPGGRLVVISFHSLEDRIVKRFMRSEARGDDFPPDLPVPAAALRPRLRLVGKARRPDAREVGANPRARSAVMRVAERTEVPCG
jgi:16S rRNA (cytosine1402-N4)-methyltransferase